MTDPLSPRASRVPEKGIEDQELESRMDSQCGPTDSPTAPTVAPNATITAFVCGGRQARVCQDGGEHDMSAIVRFTDGGSVACAKCGVTAMQIDLMELP